MSDTNNPGQPSQQSAAQVGGTKPPTALTKEIVAQSLRALTNVVYDAQTKIGHWGPEEIESEDLGSAFAEIFAKLGRAYDGYREGASPTNIVWIDEMTGSEVMAGHGIPQGMSADIGEVVFDLLGLTQRLGIDVGTFVDIAAAHARYADQVDDDDGEDDGDDNDDGGEGEEEPGKSEPTI